VRLFVVDAGGGKVGGGVFWKEGVKKGGGEGWFGCGSASIEVGGTTCTLYLRRLDNVHNVPVCSEQEEILRTDQGANLKEQANKRYTIGVRDHGMKYRPFFVSIAINQ